MSKRAVLLTGSHRSGSTWVGKMIAESSSIAYIHEPFNVANPPGVGICSAKFNYWFTYISIENEEDFYGPIKRTLDFSYDLGRQLAQVNQKKSLFQIYKEYFAFNKYRILRKRPLLKDPIALFSAEWLTSKFDMDVIVLIRHPAAFASSLKQKGWQFPFSHLLKQPLLIEKYLYPFEAELKAYSNNKYDIIDQASLLWKILHHVIFLYQQKHKDWCFVRHEDISDKPLCMFQNIFDFLNLEFTTNNAQVIKEYSSIDNPTEGNKHSTHTLKRNSKANIRTWKNRLTNLEIARIRSQVNDISHNFYSDEDWE